MHRKAGQDVVNRSRRHYNNGESPSYCEEFSSSCSNDDSVPAPDPLRITRRNYLVGHLLTQKKRHAAARGGKRDITSLQEMWLSHCRQAASFYTPSMWRVLHAVKNEAKTTQSPRHSLRCCPHVEGCCQQDKGICGLVQGDRSTRKFRNLSGRSIAERCDKCE